MAENPLAVKTVPADEQWNETLDALARAVTREMETRGLLAEGAAPAVRYHVRGYARRLLVPVLDRASGEVRAGHRELRHLREENRRLRLRLALVRRARSRRARRAALAGALATALLWLAVALL